MRARPCRLADWLADLAGSAGPQCLQAAGSLAQRSETRKTTWLLQRQSTQPSMDHGHDQPWTHTMDTSWTPQTSSDSTHVGCGRVESGPSIIRGPTAIHLCSLLGVLTGPLTAHDATPPSAVGCRLSAISLLSACYQLSALSCLLIHHLSSTDRSAFAFSGPGGRVAPPASFDTRILRQDCRVLLCSCRRASVPEADSRGR